MADHSMMHTKQNECEQASVPLRLWSMASRQMQHSSSDACCDALRVPSELARDPGDAARDVLLRSLRVLGGVLGRPSPRPPPTTPMPLLLLLLLLLPSTVCSRRLGLRLSGGVPTAGDDDDGLLPTPAPAAPPLGRAETAPAAAAAATAPARRALRRNRGLAATTASGVSGISSAPSELCLEVGVLLARRCRTERRAVGDLDAWRGRLPRTKGDGVSATTPLRLGLRVDTDTPAPTTAAPNEQCHV